MGGGGDGGMVIWVLVFEVFVWLGLGFQAVACEVYIEYLVVKGKTSLSGGTV